jgi:hypothetical protein
MKTHQSGGKCACGDTCASCKERKQQAERIAAPAPGRRPSASRAPDAPEHDFGRIAVVHE